MNQRSRHYSIHTMAIVAFALAMAFLAVFTVYILYGNMSGMLAQSETRLVQTIGRIVFGSIDSAIDSTRATTREYAERSETANFIISRSSDHEGGLWESNWTLQKRNIDFAIIKDANGNTLLFETYTDGAPRTAKARDEFSAELSPHTVHALKVINDTAHGRYYDRWLKSGFVINEGEAYFVCIMPVTHRGTINKPLGALILGFRFDQRQIETLAPTEKGISFVVRPVKKEHGVITNAVLDGDVASLSRLYSGLDSSGDIVLSASKTRVMYKTGQTFIRNAVITLFVMMTIFVAAIFIFMRKYMLKPIAALSANIADVSRNYAHGKENAAVTREFYDLCVSINGFLGRLERSKRSEEASKISIGVLKSILNGMDAYIYASDPQTDEILFINDRMRKHFGLESAGVGEICWQALQKNMPSRCPFCPTPNLLSAPNQVVVWEEHNTSTLRYYKNTDCLINWPGGRRAHLQHSVDITEIKEAELEMGKAKEEAEKANRAKSDFLSRMSHEMRTPLNAVIGMARMATKTDNPERKDYCLAQITIASAHLLGIISDILDMSKIEADKLELTETEFDFAAMIATATDLVRHKVDEKDHELKVELLPGIPERIKGDRQRIIQILTSLLSNAAKFTPAGGAITLTARKLPEEGCVLRFDVADNGIGISEEQRKLLFQPFEQIDGGVARRFDGTGLGLAICKKLIELMDGQIWLEKGSGACFSFTITACAADEQSGQERDGVGSPNLSGHTVLLAEDNDINAEIAIALLEECGLTIHLAENGRRAVEMFEANPDTYSLILMDIHMPEVDGFEAARRIRAINLPKAATIPIVAMTANVFKEDVDKCLASGMDGHIGKPIDPAVLYASLRKFLRRPS